MKRIFSVLLSLLLLLSLFSVTAFAAEENDISKFELPAPKAPNYFIYTDGDASECLHFHFPDRRNQTGRCSLPYPRNTRREFLNLPV